ncbi:MAG: hypothetical protein AAGK97_10015, partial [Bacteroidota bacterium]
VIIYTRGRDDQWLRTREILAPKNSTAHKIGSGFGNTIALDRDSLMVGTFTVIKAENNDVVNPSDFQEDNGIFSTSTALYKARLNKETKVEQVNLTNIPNKGVFPTGKIVSENGKTGLIFSQKQPEKRINQVYVLSNDKAYALSNGKLEYKSTSRAWIRSLYGNDIALKNNLLLVSVDRDKGSGGVWLFDLNSSKSKPQKIDIPLAAPAIVSVAISEEFIVISNYATSSYHHLPNLLDTTLIKNIITGETRIIGGSGEVSLDGNIFARTRSVPNGRKYSNTKEMPRVLEVFRLDEDATPHLIQKRSNIESGLLQNRLLITIQKTASARRVCTEEMDQIIN